MNTKNSKMDATDVMGFIIFGSMVLIAAVAFGVHMVAIFGLI